jgi:4-alpha-glucanotransferase
MNDLLARLAEAYGIAPGYVSESGEHRITSDAAKRGVLKALGVTEETEAALSSHAIEALRAHKAPNAEALRCFVPDWLHDAKVWGITCQLYGLRSSRNAGIGDFEDLAHLAELAANAGAEFIGVNPLHALFFACPEFCSPYSPSSRRFLNPLHIALDRLGVPTPPDLEAVHASEFIDYEAVGRLKRKALAERYRELGAAAFEMPAAKSFKAFVAERGEALRLFALFETLSESMVAEGRTAGWQGWPEVLQNPATPEVETFARANDGLIRFHMWKQWIADMQLANAHQRAIDAGMRIGLYLDIAVGVAPDGAETWMDRASVVPGVRIGSPPDPFNERGQDWGLAPLSPVALREHDCAGFVSVIDVAMQHAGAVRIDHVMGLMRLYWIPEGASANDGAYVHYPLDDLMAHLAGASRRNQAIVIGEDLGTVPPGFRDILRQAEIQGCRVLYFELDGNAFRAAESYPRETLACVSTHDLPTLRGWWAGLDIEARQRAGICSSDSAAGWRTLRAEERHALVARLCESGLMREDILAGRSLAVSPTDQMPDEVCVAVHRFLARAPARFVAVQLEDLAGMSEQANLPGTIDEHPNWRRKLTCGLDELSSGALFSKITLTMAEERPKRP